MTGQDGNSDGRRQRSRRTRGRIVDAAVRLFTGRGYVATTVEDVAQEAGVAVQTVYYVFGTKPKLLAAVLDTTIAGDVEAVPIVARAWVQALGAQNDITSAVERLVDDTVAILARTTPVYEVVRRAAADAEVDALLQQTRRRRRADQRALIETLWSSGLLGRDTDLDTAADVFYGIMNEEVFELLTGDCGWTVDRFRAWATALMLQQLTRTGRSGIESRRRTPRPNVSARKR